MTNFKKNLIGAVALALFLAPSQWVLAWTPELSVETYGGSSAGIDVKGAEPHSRITLYQRQGTELWTVVENFGTTDEDGDFWGSVNLNNGYSGTPTEYYVMVNGKSSGVEKIYFSDPYCSGSVCLVGNRKGNKNKDYNNNKQVDYANYYGNVTFSDNNVTLNINQNKTVSVYGGINSSYYISNNSNSSAVDASLSGSQLYLYPRSHGNAQVTVCSNNSGYCSILYLTVTGSGGQYGSITFSETSPVISVGQNKSFSVYRAYSDYNYNYQNLYVSSISDRDVIQAHISGNTLNVYGLKNGSSTVTVCQTNQACGSLYISVIGSNAYCSNSYNYPNNNYNYNYNYNCDNYSGGNPYFSTNGLPGAYNGQYYSYQLLASGGSPGYTFALASGSLPSGLTLNYNGTLSGTPYCYSYSGSTFTIQVTDNAGRRATQAFSLPVSGCGYSYQGVYNPYYGYGGTNEGYVQSSYTYKNGSLIKENGTVYIVYRNLKTGFTNQWAFEGLGYRWGSVQDVYGSSLQQSGYTVSSANVRHPWGSWIKSGQTIYFVHEQGLIPVPSWDMFVNNGGEEKFVVPTNNYDFAAPMLTVLTYNDSRLR